ncbi:MAG: hypothetical protein J0I47_11950 [Sphingomonas sp.]|uniref:hypothetical protein n=1 Tax=Sphingomonas sp. TaxID=28214 RepID=UPI001AD0475F|nr:hypothetical protein [Sphingomonas sp.]MBN8808927.1 hypothetical protein [Sphingomonas sp.]
MRPIIWLAAVAAVVTPAIARDRGVPAATPAGKAVDCVNTTDIQQTHVRSDQVIDFEMRGGRTYRNTLPYACPSLGFEQRFGYKLSTTQLCSVDTITVLQSGGMRGPSCGLGQFQPVTIAK